MCVDLCLGFLFWGTPIFISRRALSSTDKVTCTPRVLIPSNSSALALHSCMLSGCPCVCVCVSTHRSRCRLLLVCPLLHASLPCLRLCLLPHHCLYWHRPRPSRTVFLSCPMAISSVCLCSFLPPIHSSVSSLLFSPPRSLFFFLLPPPSITLSLYHPLPTVPPLLSLSLPLRLSLYQYLTPTLLVPLLQ